MSDPTDTPSFCIQPDPSVSGWWHVITDEKSNDGREVAEWMTYGGLCTPHWRSRGTVLSILGPVTPHAEVEALRAEGKRLRKLVADLRGDVIEAHARASGCLRSAASMRACLYADGAVCECRMSMEARWPEHMKDAIINKGTMP